MKKLRYRLVPRKPKPRGHENRLGKVAAIGMMAIGLVMLGWGVRDVHVNGWSPWNKTVSGK
jgi:hypothetical protein